MNFKSYLYTSHLNEAYSKDLTKELKARGLLKKLSDVLNKSADVSVNDVDFEKAFEYEKPVSVSAAFSDIKHNIHVKGTRSVVILLHAEGATIGIGRGYEQSGLAKKNTIEVGDVDSKVYASYIGYNDDTYGSEHFDKRFRRADSQHIKDYAHSKGKIDLMSAITSTIMANPICKEIRDLLYTYGVTKKSGGEYVYAEKTTYGDYNVTLNFTIPYGNYNSEYTGVNNAFRIKFDSVYGTAKINDKLITTLTSDFDVNSHNLSVEGIDKLSDNLEEYNDDLQMCKKLMKILAKYTVGDILINRNK